MYTYYSSFVTGTQNVIKNNLNDCNIQKLMDGGILYTTNKTPEEIEKIRFFNNTFMVVQIFENIDGRTPIEDMIENVNFDGNKSFLNYIKSKKRARTFHIFSSIENQLVSVDKKILGRFENELEKLTRLRTEFGKKVADLEFWFLYRTEKIGFFMLRITKNKKKLEKGELRPELTNILSLISEPKEDDIFLDPFCGSGAIPLERSRMANFKGIFACDRNEEEIKNLKEKIKSVKSKKLNKSFFVKKLDFFENKFDDNYFTTIVTDPPWGFFEKVGNIELFHTKMFEEMHRILIKNGLIVILTANKDLVTKNLNSMQLKLKLVETYDILVSGKKAAIYKIQKL